MLTLLIPAAPAATLVVGASSAAQFGTIASAVAAAQSGDTIEVEPGDYVGGVDLAGKALEIRSQDGAGSTSITGGDWALLVADNGEPGVVLDGFTLHNPGGVVFYADAGAQVTLRNLTVEDSGYSGIYGGVVTMGAGSLTIEDSTFRRNTGGYGGHLYLGSGTLDVRGSTLDTGVGNYGGAAFVNGGVATFTDCAVTGNDGAYGGGAFYAASGASLALVNTDVTGNFSESYHGGGIFLAGANTLTVDGGSLSGNQITTWEAGYAGGAIAAPSGGTLTLRNTELSENTAYYGGAIFGVGITLTLDGATIDRNYAYYGGGVYERQSLVSSAGTLWDSNTTYYYGGAVYSETGSTWVVNGDTFRENLATYGYGGAMIIGGAHVSFADTAFEKNLAYYYGGALFLTSLYDTAVLTGGSFDQNEAQYGNGGAIYAEYYSSVSADGTAFTHNDATTDGLAYLYYGSSLAGSGLTATGNTATRGAGGVHVYGGGVPTSVSLTGSELDDNASEGDAGALNLDAVVQVELQDNRFLRNRAGGEGFGGAVLIQDSGRTTVQGNVFAFNVARYGGGAYLDAASSPGVWTNNAFVENTAAFGGGACIADSAAQSWANNTFAGNAATESGGALCTVDTEVDLRNNLFAWTSEGTAIQVWQSGKAAPTFGYDGFYANADGDAGGDVADVTATPGSITADPRLVAYTRDGDLDDDNLQPLRDSALVDAGDPALLDPDGTVSDIGLTGGPYASDLDGDRDGFPASTDCDDTNAQVNPDAFETWYDGVNADCRGASDFDQDGDGTDAAAYGGADCDDTDPSVTDPCADDTGGDPERPPADNKVGGSCGCASAGSSASATIGLLAGLTLLGRRRRR